MSDLEEIKKRKIQEMMAAQGEEQQAQQQIHQLETMIKQFLSKEALERYGNLKVAYANKAMNVLVILSQMIQKGHIKSQISDSQLKEILKSMEKKRDIKITRK